VISSQESLSPSPRLANVSSPLLPCRERFFPQKKDGTPLGGAYIRVGEYGEVELNKDNRYSVFKEPLNAWSSLAYCVWGIVICIVGTYDYFDFGFHPYHGLAPNRMAGDNGFSVMIGSFLLYLGLTSFLFHASHSPTWWRANNGMTSGLMIPLVLFAGMYHMYHNNRHNYNNNLH
jgi:hypothetical protein